MNETAPKTRYVINTRVLILNKEERITTGFKDKDGGFPIFKEELGWYVLFAGSREKLFLGNDKPDLNEGDNVRITIEKIND